MSVGGRVVEVVAMSPSKVWVNTDDNWHRRHGTHQNECAVYVDPDGQTIRPGDSLWWQGPTAYWTPQDRPFGASDIPLKRIGFSGVTRPAEGAPS